MRNDLAPMLPDDVAGFLRRGIGLVVASRDAALCPSVAKALACRLEGDGRTLTVFVVRTHALQLLRDVAAQGVLTVTCSQPSTHRTLQFKGEDATEVALQPGDAQMVGEAAERYVDDLASIGFPPAYGRAICAHRVAEVAAIRFTVAACFDQTPGPQAGKPISRPGLETPAR